MIALLGAVLSGVGVVLTLATGNPEAAIWAGGSGFWAFSCYVAERRRA